MKRRFFTGLVFLFFLLLSNAAAHAQCPEGWLPGDGLPGTNGTINAMTMWDPDGPGPLPARLVIGGSFSIAGNVQSHISAYDPATGQWSALGAGIDEDVNALAVLANGDLVAGGSFTAAGGAPANYVARWDGSGWWALGSGMDGPVNALTLLPNGDLIVGGEFDGTGDWETNLNGIARWDGSAWSALGSGLTFFGTTAAVEALVVLPNGDLVAGGTFNAAGGASANRIARWNGSAWSRFGSGVNGPVSALAVLPGGDIVAGGAFTTAGGVTVNHIARWNGSAWSALGSGLDGAVSAFAVLPGGDLVAGGAFIHAGGVTVNFVARWNGSAWSALGSGIYTFNALPIYAFAVLPGGDLIAGGGFTIAGNVMAYRVARWDGAAWSSLGTGISNMSPYSPAVLALAVLPDGDLVVGGEFTSIGGVPVNYIARWNGSSWSALGSGMNPHGPVRALAVLPNGDLVAGGAFSTAGGVPVNYVARWNGLEWSPLGSGMNAGGYVNALAVLPNGDLVAGGQFGTAGGQLVNYIARWNGSAWSALGTGMDGYVNALAVLPSGDLVAGGRFGTAGGAYQTSAIARWNGAAWSAVTYGIYEGQVMALTVLPDGDLVVGGTFTSAGGVAANEVARWNGSAWSALGAGMNRFDISSNAFVEALAVLPSGDLVAGGAFTTYNGAPGNFIARWNGSEWSALGAGMAGIPTDTAVCALTVLASGDLVVGGAFQTAGESVSASLARYSFGGTAPEVTGQPAGALACMSGSASFHVAGAGTAPLSYQWQVQYSGGWLSLTDGAGVPIGPSYAGNVQGSSTSQLTVGSVTDLFAHSNVVQFRCVVTNSCGSVNSNAATLTRNSADFNGDGDLGTDSDIAAFFACLSGNCCPACGSADFNADGDLGTDKDIEAFFRVLGGGSC